MQFDEIFDSLMDRCSRQPCGPGHNRNPAMPLLPVRPLVKERTQQLEFFADEGFRRLCRHEHSTIAFANSFKFNPVIQNLKTDFTMKS